MFGFPNDFKGSLMILNSTKEPINVYLDPTKPIFSSNFSWGGNPDDFNSQSLDEIWGKCDAKFYRYFQNTTKSSPKLNRIEELLPNECWIIVLPRDKNNMPVWCEGNDECTGSGGWITKSSATIPTDDKNIHRPERTMRFEFNWNGNDIWYNLSAVDGLNSNIGLKYTGCNKLTSCVVDLNKCPTQFKNNGIPSDWNYNTCVGPPQIQSIDDVCNGVRCSGCGSSDCKTMCYCRKYWQTNPTVLQWKNFVQGDNNCNVYSWAYDELIIKNPDNCDCNNFSCTDPLNCTTCTGGNCNYINNSINPLLNCPKTSDGNLLVKIFNVL